MNSKSINKIREIVQLKQIMKKWRSLALRTKISTVNGCAISPTGSLYDSDEEECRVSPESHPADVPEGYLAVYVGKQERRRFIIPTSYLSHPVFRSLLDKAEEEFGFNHKGPLTIPCDALLFQSLLRMLDTNPGDDHLNLPDAHVSSLSPPHKTSG